VVGSLVLVALVSLLGSDELEVELAALESELEVDFVSEVAAVSFFSVSTGALGRP